MTSRRSGRVSVLLTVLLAAAVLLCQLPSASASTELQRHPLPKGYMPGWATPVDGAEASARIVGMLANMSLLLDRLYEQGGLYTYYQLVYNAGRGEVLTPFPDLFIYYATPFGEEAPEDIAWAWNETARLGPLVIYTLRTVPQAEPTTAGGQTAEPAEELPYKLPPLLLPLFSEETHVEVNSSGSSVRLVSVSVVLDYITIFSISLDAASAIARGDLESFQRASDGARVIYAILLEALKNLNASRSQSGEGAMLLVFDFPLIPDEAEIRDLLPALQAVGPGEAQLPAPSPDYLRERSYTSYIVSGRVLNFTMPLVLGAETAFSPDWDTVAELLEAGANLTGYIASLLPLDPDLSMLLPRPGSPLAPLGPGLSLGLNITVNASGGPGGGGEEAGAGGGSRVSEVGLADLDKLLSGIVPEPSDIAKSLLRSGAGEGGSGGLRVDINGLASAARGLPKPAIAAAPLPRPQVTLNIPGPPRQLPLLLAAAAAVALVAWRWRAVTGRLAPLLKGLYAGVASRFGGGVGGVVGCYLAALAASRPYAGPKGYSETPREYLARAAPKLPPKTLQQLQKATKTYEQYRYTKNKNTKCY